MAKGQYMLTPIKHIDFQLVFKEIQTWREQMDIGMFKNKTKIDA